MAFVPDKLVAAIALLTAVVGVHGQNDSSLGTGPNAAGPTWNHADYETSPPVYPSPNATGQGWDGAFQQAANFVSQLTLDEKAQIVTGTPGPCTGNIGPIYRLGFDGLCLQDGPLAIRQADYASVFPAGLTVAASWDRDLARQRGIDMAMEFKEKGADVALGPVAGPLGRSGYGGRNWEGFSPDPYLTGELFGVTIEGMQSTGLQACAKHYIGNEQETQRNPSVDKQGVTIEAVSSNIDDRTMHELYLWPFQDAVKSGVASVMCSYNRINGSYGCENSKTLNGLLKEELGFQGYVMSDWEATHSGYPSANAGLDMDMPGGIPFVTALPTYFGPNITMSVNNGSLSEDRLDDMCRRIMTPYFFLKQNTNYPPVDASSGALNFFPVANYEYNFTLGPANVDVRDDHADIIRELGSAGIVLLKNTNNTLPLKTPANVGVFGNDAGDVVDGLYFGGDPDLGSVGYEYGVLPAGGGSGTGRFTYIVNPLDAIKAKVASYNQKALVQYVLNNTLVNQRGGFSILYPTPPDVCLVFLKTWATEGYDRSSLLVDWNGTALVETVAASCPNTVVVTHSGGLNVLPFANNPNVTAILAAHYAGEQVGNSIVDVLWGDVNPSGKLPYTVALAEEDYAFADITNSTALLTTTNPNAWQSDFEERLLIDYRHFDYFNESVQYEFGYGLSYTTFSMGSVSVSRAGSGSITALPPDNAIVPGGNPALWDVLYTASVSVSNTGSVAGATVPQLYLGLPQPSNEDYTPVKVLRGFEKITLQPGASQTVTFNLTRRDISYWDTMTQQWTIGTSAIGVLAGFSSRDISSNTTFSPLTSSSSPGGYSNSTSSAAGYGSGSASGSTTASASGYASVSVSASTSAANSVTASASASASSAGGYGNGNGHGWNGPPGGNWGSDRPGPWGWAANSNHGSWGPPKAKS